jgi:hypothetical protein
MIRRLLHFCLLLSVVAGATIVSTWPLSDRSAWSVPIHQDPLFSVWRLYQWSRNLFGDGPGGFADGNIFHPAKDVLFYSDAIFLPAVVAAPWIHFGVSPLVVYAVLFWSSYLAAGLGMYLFARDVSGSRAGGLVAAAIFSGAPFRAEHIMHLELLWTCWIPLAFWATRRLMLGELRAWRWLSVALVAQFLCCVYYGLFVVTILPIIAGVAWAARRHPLPRPMLMRLGLAFAIALVVVGIYSIPYSRARATVGDRRIDEIRDYGATSVSYLATPGGNWLWGKTADRLGDREKRLSVGLTAYLVALVALVPPLEPWALGLAAGTAFAFDASFGLDGHVYPLLHRFASPYAGLRVPARFGVIVLACVAGLVAIGVGRIGRAYRHPTWTVIVTAVVLGALLTEYATWTDSRTLPRRPPPLYAWLSRQPPTVIAHLPMPAADALPGSEADFQYFAQYHHHTLVNGNSGYYPPSYFLLIDRVKGFPDERAMRALRGAGVTMVILHAQHYSHGVYELKVLELETMEGVQDLGEYYDERGRARVFRLLPES